MDVRGSFPKICILSAGFYLDPKSLEKSGPKTSKRNPKAVILHTFGVQELLRRPRTVGSHVLNFISANCHTNTGAYMVTNTILSIFEKAYMITSTILRYIWCVYYIYMILADYCYILGLWDQNIKFSSGAIPYSRAHASILRNPNLAGQLASSNCMPPRTPCPNSSCTVIRQRTPVLAGCNYRKGLMAWAL